MINEHFRATIESADYHRRKLNIIAKDYFATKLNKLPNGHKVYVHVYDKEPKRSDRQNRFYWMYLNNIAEETGNDVDALHDLFKDWYLPKRRIPVKLPDGFETERELTPSTAQLTKAEFTDYLNKIEAETGVRMPNTDEFHHGTKEEQADEYRNRDDYPDPEDVTVRL